MRIVVFLVLLLTSLQLEAKWHYQQQTHMGTVIRVELWSVSEAKAQQAMAAVMAEMARIDQGMSPYIETSELYLLNQSAATKPVTVSAEFYQLLQQSLAVSRLTNGVFDITFASVGFDYDYRNKVKPTAEQLHKKLPAINFHWIELLPNSQVAFKHPNVKIDLGGIAKGHAVDNAIKLLQQQGIRHASVTAGGDTRVLGDKRGRPWVVAVKDPRNDLGSVVKLPLTDVAISTSGDYERYFIDEDGTRHHHIINPKTGDSAREVQSVTIIANDSTTADALSTSVFVLGVEKGLALIESLPNISVIIVDNRRKMHYSSDLAPPNSN